MPNINISVYLTDENFLIFSKNKKEISGKTREFTKKEISKHG